MRSKMLLLCAAAILSACDRDAADVRVGPLTVAAAPAIAGGTLRATSVMFTHDPGSLTLNDSIPLTTTIVDDTTLVAQLPRNMRGQFWIEYKHQIIQSIEIAGFDFYRARTVDLVGNPLQLSDEGPVQLLQGQDNALVRFTPGTGEINTLVNDVWLDNANTRSPGITPDPFTFLLQPRSTDMQAWTLFPTPHVATSYPGQYLWRYAALISDSVFLFGTHHEVHTAKLGNGVWTQAYGGTYEETNGVVVSPDKRLATIRVHGSVTGPPVFNTATGDTVYHLRQMYGNEGVSFSATGDTLFVLGYDHHQAATAYAIDARNGRTLASYPLPQWSEDMAYDAREGYWYFAVLDNAIPQGPATNAFLHIVVMDARSFQIVGDMAVDHNADFVCFYRGIYIGDDGMFFVCNGDTWRFDRVVRN